MEIAPEHLEHVKQLGYEVNLIRELNSRGVPKTFLVGKCPANHQIKSEIRKSFQVPSCRFCYHESLTETEKSLRELHNLGYSATSYTKRIPSGRNKIFLSGTCPKGHELNMGLLKFMLNPHCKKCGEKAGLDIQEYHSLLENLGYQVQITKELQPSGRYKKFIEGICPKGHILQKVSRGFVPNPRCNSCYLNEIRESNLFRAHSEGYKVEIVVTQVPNRENRTYFVGKCPNEHPVDIKVVDFISGNRRCSPCKKELISRRVEEIIKETGYKAKVERVSIKSKDRDSRLFVVGRCPVGHPVRINANSFEKGARCKGCVKYGFSTARSAVFYIIHGEEVKALRDSIALKADYKNRPVLKYGVFHPASGRLSIHQSHGFNPLPTMALYNNDSTVIAELEKRVKDMVKARGIRSCKELGVKFDGASESFYEDDLTSQLFIKNIKKIVKEVEKEYKTSFQKISAEDAVVIGRRSQSFTTKEKIDKIISKMESDLSSTTKQKEHAHG